MTALCPSTKQESQHYSRGTGNEVGKPDMQRSRGIVKWYTRTALIANHKQRERGRFDFPENYMVLLPNKVIIRDLLPLA